MKHILSIVFACTTIMLGGSSGAFAATPDGSDLAKTRTTEADSKLNDEQLAKVLEQRVPGGLGVPFSRLAKMALTSKTGKQISLVTKSDKISKTMLRSNFPGFYKPTLKEFFEAIALQSFSEWKYDASNSKQAIVFEFSEASRRKPYEVALAKGWSTKDNGNWVMCTPPGQQVGMDIYELGNFTSINKGNEGELLKQVPYEVAMEWAQRVQPKAKKSDLKPTKVGNYDAVFYEATVRTQAKKDVHWRQWVFMAGNQCFFIVSTIFPESEKTVWPEVENMLKTFKLR